MDEKRVKEITYEKENEKMRKNTVIHTGKSRIWTGSIIAALVAAAVLFAVMMQMEKNMLTQYEKGSILLAAGNIPKGQLITLENCATYFKEAELDKKCIPATALTSVEQLQDMVAAANIDEGTLLTKGMFETFDDITKDMKNPVIAGFKAEDLFQVVSGVLRTGDKIHIYYVTEEGKTVLNWRNVFIQQVFDNAGNSIANGDNQTAAQRINIYLNETDVEEFYSELATGSLRVVKVCN